MLKQQESFWNKVDSLFERLHGCTSAAIAFSGGVDSSFLAAAAKKALRGRTAAVTAVSPTLSALERANARTAAAEIGIKHVEIASDETGVPEFAANNADRCYYCKKYRLKDICLWAEKNGYEWVLEGSNADDAYDYRPGIKALAEYPKVKSPLKDSGLRKDEIRALAKDWGLSFWDKPSSPCLASRIKYGVPVTAGRLKMIEDAEAAVAAYCPGKSNIRVRCHEDLARIEVDAEIFPVLAERRVAGEIAEKLAKLGFSFVTLDLAGFRTGSLNAGLEK
ncbi:MAG: ATP-dependent sacrificial sulfur transferase LarE [Acidaminococcales bacterium]|nr:ATP-dependent sacrificial sulfur transferase LarE [Acidaminococcales bacterium]